ncbi:hypothetical protein [Klebsiella michiganensis]|uniref:hypothetical protein n=1 Tax=Klebsiella michiganensis TaxID=1134687 RepID=UPI0012B74B6A|nr:hypothetical protein [Klebsiella michiganensis]EKV0315853.1 hypothetical protein [Klebsiella pneumoniae]EKV0319326.1 hypothetical protein [Klebsiella pneumoniae]EKV0319363.1 hypothetical protein [Klebsiella pneumoniae]
MTDITNLVKNLRHWANMASLTSEQVSCLSVQQLETIASELHAAHQHIADLESFRTAYMEWSNKTDWVRDDKRFDIVKPLGKHLADVLKAYIEHLESRTVKLPVERFCPAEYAGSQLWSETEVWNKAITACADALRAAGIKWEAE